MTERRRGSAGPEFRLVLSPNRQAGSRAREAIRQRFSETLSERALNDLVTVVTELVNNAVKHGPGKPVTVTLAVGAEAIRGEVEDQGNPNRAIPEIAEATDSGRFGLDVVDKLTAEWAVYEGSTHVWFKMPREE